MYYILLTIYIYTRVRSKKESQNQNNALQWGTSVSNPVVKFVMYTVNNLVFFILDNFFKLEI